MQTQRLYKFALLAAFLASAVLSFSIHGELTALTPAPPGTAQFYDRV